jgi:ABC-2 type transport system permease protein
MSTWIVLRREIAHYAGSPFAYLIGFAFLFFTGLVFADELQTSAVAQTITNPAVIPSVLSLLMVFIAPLLTMRLLAEERREGTLELLLTAPVTDGAIVIGKFLGAWSYYTVLLLITLAYQIVLSVVTLPDFGHTIGAYIGIWLYGGATLAVGLFFSSLTENQIVAAFFSLITLLILWLADGAGRVIGNIDIARIVRVLSLQAHYAPSFGFGLLKMEDIAFFLGIIFIMLFLSIRALESTRWR